MLTRQRLLEIFYTALMGAGIAFIQSLLMSLTSHPNIVADPALAAGIGGVLRAGYISKFTA